MTQLMKKNGYIFMLAVVSLLLSACDSEVIYDIAPTVLKIVLVDEDGNNLLDRSVPGNWAGEAMNIEYKGKEYSAVWTAEELYPRSRMYVPMFSGLVWSKITEPNDAGCLWFGEFSGEKDFDMSLKFSIEKLNSDYEFGFYQKTIGENGNRTNCIIYNGKKEKGTTLTLIVPRNDTAQ